LGYEHSKVDVDIIANKVMKIFDYLNEYTEDHEKTFNDLIGEPEYALFLTQDMTISEIHAIDVIGKNQLPNATFIANELKMTKGAISKVTSKLLKKALIKADHLNGNNKMIYYSLTPKGKALYEIHAKLHMIEYDRFVTILSEYTKDEVYVINSFLEDLLNKL
jgi:DNA-binding MarR family transcriptional regulator